MHDHDDDARDDRIHRALQDAIAARPDFRARLLATLPDDVRAKLAAWRTSTESDSR